MYRVFLACIIHRHCSVRSFNHKPAPSHGASDVLPVSIDDSKAASAVPNCGVLLDSVWKESSPGRYLARWRLRRS